MSTYTNPAIDAALEYFHAYYNPAEATEDHENLFPYFIADVLHAGFKLTGLDPDVLTARALHVMAGDIESLDDAPAKVPVLVYAFHTFESGGGFSWLPDTPDNRDLLLSALRFDLAHKNYDSGTLVSMHVPEYGDDRQAVTDLFEWQLQDAIEVGRIGHIIERFSHEPVDQ